MHKVFLWGIGPYFRKMWPQYKVAEESGEINILGIIDRDKAGGSLFGKRIIRLEEAKKNDYDYLVISSGYNYDMYQNAVREGIPDDVLIDGHIYANDVLPCDYQFINRQSHTDDLLIVVAGYREIIWDAVFGRIERFLPENIDVCVVVPGRTNQLLKDLCEKNSWSYLETVPNQLALAQNVAIRLHPDAKYIYKLDEDIFITKSFFSGMKEMYLHIRTLRKYNIGFVVPLINVNGYSYRFLLEHKNKVAEYESKFGPAIMGWQIVKAHFDGDVAEYLWDISFPLDKTAEEMAGRGFSICPQRFSIGAMFFTRAFWGKIGGFTIADEEGVLGIEEKELCEFCARWAYAIICAENVFVGHHGFGIQRAQMDEYFLKNKDKFM